MAKGRMTAAMLRRLAKKLASEEGDDLASLAARFEKTATGKLDFGAMTPAEARAVALRNMHVQKKGGTIVGAPPGFNLSDVAEQRTFAKKLMNLGSDTAGWYPRSRDFWDSVHPDPEVGRAAGRGTTVYSPQKTPGKDSDLALQQWYAEQVGMPGVKPNYADQKRKMDAIMAGKDPGPLGPKVGAYERAATENVPYEDVNEAVIDRRAGFALGHKAVEGEGKKANFTQGQHRYAQGEYLRLAEWLNSLPDTHPLKRKVLGLNRGRPIRPTTAQEMAWGGVGIFSDLMDRKARGLKTTVADLKRIKAKQTANYPDILGPKAQPLDADVIPTARGHMEGAGSLSPADAAAYRETLSFVKPGEKHDPVVAALRGLQMPQEFKPGERQTVKLITGHGKGGERDKASQVLADTAQSFRNAMTARGDFPVEEGTGEVTAKLGEKLRRFGGKMGRNLDDPKLRERVGAMNEGEAKLLRRMNPPTFKPAWRNAKTGEVVDAAGPMHSDVLNNDALPLETRISIAEDTANWESGFMDEGGKFFGRDDAGKAVGNDGPLDSIGLRKVRPKKLQTGPRGDVQKLRQFYKDNGATGLMRLSREQAKKLGLPGVAIGLRAMKRNEGEKE